MNGGQIANYNGWSNEWSGSITLNTNLTAKVPNYLRLSGVIGGSGGISKTSGSLLELSGINTYSSDMTANAGSITFADNGGFRLVLTILRPTRSRCRNG